MLSSKICKYARITTQSKTYFFQLLRVEKNFSDKNNSFFPRINIIIKFIKYIQDSVVYIVLKFGS